MAVCCQLTGCGTAAVVGNLHFFVNLGTGLRDHLCIGGTADITPGIEIGAGIQHDLGVTLHDDVAIALYGTAAEVLTAMGRIVLCAHFDIAVNLNSRAVRHGQGSEHCWASPAGIRYRIRLGIAAVAGIRIIIGNQQGDAFRNRMTAGQNTICIQNNLTHAVILGKSTGFCQVIEFISANIKCCDCIGHKFRLVG